MLLIEDSVIRTQEMEVLKLKNIKVKRPQNELNLPIVLPRIQRLERRRGTIDRMPPRLHNNSQIPSRKNLH